MYHISSRLKSSSTHFSHISRRKANQTFNMYAKLFVVALCAAIAMAVAPERYPAGLNPALCPNYPDCDNALIALHSGNPSAYAYNHAREYPAGVHPAACPNYPYCGTYAPLAYSHIAREYPAGVHPAACPNYPYCH